MAHTVLARKWRPKKFADLIGQQTAVTVLNNILQNKRLHHAYLLTGTRGVGKTTIARIIAKALNCNNLQAAEPCGLCENCQDIDKGRFVDVIEIDAASNTGVDNIRELIDNAQYAPTLGEYKVYIIDEVHMLSKSAFNAMLKTLEEPPAHAVFILATTDLQKVPITILSRCLQLKLRNLLPHEIAAHLALILKEEGADFGVDALDTIAHAANGSMRDALSITDQALAYTNNNVNLSDTKDMLGITDDAFIYKILDTISQANSSNLVTLANEIYTQGHDLENVLLKLNQLLCEISLVQLGGLNHEKLTNYAKSFSINDTQLYFEISNLGLEQIVKGTNKYQVFIMTLLRMIAFTIGSDNEKQVIITNNNFNTNTELQTVATKSDNTQVKSSKTNYDNNTAKNNLTAKAKENILQDNDVTSKMQTMHTDQIFFDGNWVLLIEQLENKLDKAVQPVLINARLDSYHSEKFNITVDNKYQSAVNANIIANIRKIFSEYFSKEIEINVKFSENIGTTLKEKRQTEQEEKQKTAEYSIKNDENLIKMQQLFSATILPNSIKPI